MRNIGYLALACLVSLLGYFVLFGLVVKRPLTLDVVRPILDKKLAYAAHATGPKIFILAGSNARFSHSCAVLERRLFRPCINLGVSGDISLDWIVEHVRPHIRSGDLFYIPAEYPIYTTPRSLYLSRADAAYMFRHDRQNLLTRGPEGVIRAAFAFNIGTLVRSLGEMVLDIGGVRRRVATLNAQGDEINHGDAKAKPFEPQIRAIEFSLPTVEEFLAHPDGGQLFLGRFLDWCRANHVQVVGGLPTTFADVEVSPDLVAHIAAFYRSHGAQFMILPDRSKFRRSDFYDSRYHLRDRAQIAHSEQLARALRKLLEAGTR